MTYKEFTDEEIITGLKRCLSTTTAEACVGCPFSKQKLCDKDQWALERYALDLISRQKSEIDIQNTFIESQNELISKLALAGKNATIEAYKKFAERIKLSIKANIVETLCNDVKGVYNAEYVLDDIDNLLKEMVGEEE